MTERIRVSTGSPWEPVVGYCRAIRIGNVVEGDAYQQMKQILITIEEALLKVGATMDDVVRTRMFVTNISMWEEIGRAHGEYFKDIRPVATMVEVKSLIDPELLVEIEVQAIIT